MIKKAKKTKSKKPQRLAINLVKLLQETLRESKKKTTLILKRQGQINKNLQPNFRSKRQETELNSPKRRVSS